MEKETILHLQQPATADLLEKQLLNVYQDPYVSGGLMMVPDGFNVKDIEKHLPSRMSFRATFKTDSIENFSQYLVDKSLSDGGAVFVNAEDMQAVSIFDIGDITSPGHGHHRASVSIKKTAAFLRLSRVNDQELSQKAMAELLEDMAPILSCVNLDDSNIALPAVVHAVRNVNIEALRKQGSSENSFVSEKSDLERLAVSDPDKLPAFVSFKLVPYHGLRERSITCRFGVLTGDALRFKLQIVNIEQLQEDLADEFKETLAANIRSKGVEPTIYVGEFTL